ncbi:aldo/keto reductase [Variovorax ureilyticus]|uniref:Aldo/keto reductase n=1 Tax=Variovorax ureilyticus TaxID=1836198 RepID=A0ABU8VRA6_9BURK
MTELETRRLGQTAVSVTTIGVGTSPLGGCGVPVPFSDFEAVILAAYERGVRYFDTAPLYGLGKAEHSLGHILRVNGLLGDVVLSTKVGRVLKPASRAARAETLYPINWIEPLPFVDEYDYSYDGILRSFEDSQQRLGADHIDILYVHDVGRVWFQESYPRYLKQLRDGGFRALDELRSSGAVSAIGLGVNETASVLEISREFKLDCSLVAGRYSLLNHEPLQEFFPECKRRGISIIAGGVFNSGILAEGSQGNATNQTYDYQAAPAEILKRVRALEEVCDRHGVTLPAAALQFVRSHPGVSSVVVGALGSHHVEANLDAASSSIPEAFWSELRERGLIPADAPTTPAKRIPGATHQE